VAAVLKAQNSVLPVYGGVELVWDPKERREIEDI
jgi:hypothetical protein